MYDGVVLWIYTSDPEESKSKSFHLIVFAYVRQEPKPCLSQGVFCVERNTTVALTGERGPIVLLLACDFGP